MSYFENMPNNKGYFGDYGGRFVADTLYYPLEELEKAFDKIIKDKNFKTKLENIFTDFVGRKTPLYFAKNLSKEIGGAKIYLKREDLTHTGAHKINNAMGQILLAKEMGKKRIVAETGAGQHGVATATACANFGLECIVYMGEKDMKRQAPNVMRMELLGARVEPVKTGSKTLKDAVSEAMRDWVTNVDDTYYLLGSALGPYPYPKIVREFQKIIGIETKKQILQKENKLPTEIVACVGGGSNAIGIFSEFIEDKEVLLTGIEAGGTGISKNSHAARFAGGKIGVFQGMKSYVLQDENGQIEETSSISAGLDYASIGPEHSYLHDIKRVKYEYVKDDDVIKAFEKLCKTEGIIPALESSHALSYTIKRAKEMKKEEIIIVNLSGRGDKDMQIVEEYYQEKKNGK